MSKTSMAASPVGDSTLQQFASSSVNKNNNHSKSASLTSNLSQSFLSATTTITTTTTTAITATTIIDNTSDALTNSNSSNRINNNNIFMKSDDSAKISLSTTNNASDSSVEENCGNGDGVDASSNATSASWMIMESKESVQGITSNDERRGSNVDDGTLDGTDSDCSGNGGLVTRTGVQAVAAAAAVLKQKLKSAIVSSKNEARKAVKAHLAAGDSVADVAVDGDRYNTNSITDTLVPTTTTTSATTSPTTSPPTSPPTSPMAPTDTLNTSDDFANVISNVLQSIIGSDSSDSDTELYPPPVTDLSESDEESVSEVSIYLKGIF